MRKHFALSLTCLLFGGTADATAKYLCTTEVVSGFAFNKTTNDWDHKALKATSKYLVLESKNHDSKFLVQQIGSPDGPFEVARCKKDFNESGFLFCSGPIVEFKMNHINKRFVSTEILGYVDVLPEINNISDKDSESPFIEIGKCSRL